MTRSSRITLGSMLSDLGEWGVTKGVRVGLYMVGWKWGPRLKLGFKFFLTGPLLALDQGSSRLKVDWNKIYFRTSSRMTYFEETQFFCKNEMTMLQLTKNCEMTGV